MNSGDAAAALEKAGVHADRDGLHVIPPEQMQDSSALHEECNQFLAKTKQFNELVADFVSVMESRSKVIETEKLRAIGLGNRVSAEPEVRKRKQVELQAMINEKKAELERLSAQHDSLVRVDAEQKALIEKLTNNEA
mmetsp:Transcript_23004/g.50325  ORF Transcript_23004/g.50325 Transcript_23004/m.50325 type:complete len:137 (-) Transcript_23004:460-870(-)|eukprot:6211788-Pleurochrysis_carterae.AAC.1